MGAAMFDSARQVVLSSIRQQHPGLTPVEERVQLFLRLYQADLTPAQVERTVARMRSAGSTQVPGMADPD